MKTTKNPFLRSFLTAAMAASLVTTVSADIVLSQGHTIIDTSGNPALGEISRSAGATGAFDSGGTATAAGTPLVNGILGPWAFVGNRYATLDGSDNVVGFTGGTAVAAFGWTSSNPDTFNYDVAATQGALGVSRTANTARYTGGAGSQTWGNSGANVTITLNGLTNAGSGTLTFAKGGTGSGTGVVVGATRELVLNADSAGIAISAPIMNNGAGSSSLTILGSAGVTLSGANTYSGGTTIAAGSLTLTGGSLGSGAVHVASGASLVHNSSQTLSQAVTGGGTITNNSGTSTFSGDFSGFTGSFVHNTSTSSTSLSSVQAASKNASYHIATNQGSLQGIILNVASGDNTFELGALSGVANSLVRNSFSVTGSSTLKVGNLDTDTEFAGIIGGGGGSIALEKVGSGELTLSGASTYTGDTLVSAGTLFVSGSLGATNVTVAADATIGGGGGIGGSLAFEAGSKLIFSSIDTLTVDGSAVTFGGFGITDLVGLTNAVDTGTYTLIDGLATVDLTNVSNVGAVNSYDLGGGKFAYFEAGSLNLVVIPEPSAVLLGGLGLVGLLRRRR